MPPTQDPKFIARYLTKVAMTNHLSPPLLSQSNIPCYCLQFSNSRLVVVGDFDDPFDMIKALGLHPKPASLILEDSTLYQLFKDIEHTDAISSRPAEWLIKEKAEHAKSILEEQYRKARLPVPEIEIVAFHTETEIVHATNRKLKGTWRTEEDTGGWLSHILSWFRR
jgi:hypothetical protein